MLKFVERVGSRVLTGVAAGFVTALAMGGTVVAITDTQFLYSSTKTGYYSIHPMAMAPDSNVRMYANDYSVATLRDANGGCYSTGVNLPQGARITELAVWYTSSAASNPIVFFHRNNLTDGTSSSLITSGNITDDSGTRMFAILPIVGGSSPVSNTGFSYGFGICPGSVDGTFRGARIAYTYTNAGD